MCHFIFLYRVAIVQEPRRFLYSYLRKVEARGCLEDKYGGKKYGGRNMVTFLEIAFD